MDRLTEINRAVRYVAWKQYQRDRRRRRILIISSAIIGLGLGIYAWLQLFM